MAIDQQAQNNYNELMEQNPNDLKLKAISREISELINDQNQNNDKIDFNQIITENFDITPEAATTISNYIDALLQEENLQNNKDLNRLKTYLAPIVNPANNNLHEDFNHERVGAQEIILKDGALSDLLNNKTYGLNKRMNSIINKIGNNQNLQNLKNNLLFIQDVCDGKKASYDDFDRIRSYLLDSIKTEGTETEIAGAKENFDKELTVREHNGIRNVFLLLNQFLIETEEHLKDIDESNSMAREVKEETALTNAAVTKLVDRSDFGNYSELNTGYPEINGEELSKIINYIKESSSDNINDNPKKKAILVTYRKHLAFDKNPRGNMADIKQEIENDYVETKIINDFMDNFIKSDEDNNFRDAYLDDYIIHSQHRDLIGGLSNLKDLFSLYVENDGSHNSDVISYYRRNLAEGTLATSIKDNYPEIQATEQSINKLIGITKLSNFSQLKDNDIKYITDYIVATKDISNISDTPKEKILNYYNTNIKGKAPEGTRFDQENFNSIKNAIEGTEEGTEGYREEIVQGELENLKNYLVGADITNYDFNNQMIQDYINNPRHICIFNENEFNSYKDKIQEEQRSSERETNTNDLTEIINNGEKINNVVSYLSTPYLDKLPLKDIDYDYCFYLLLNDKQPLYNSLDGNIKESLKNKFILNLNQALFDNSLKYIESFNCDFDEGKNKPEKVLYSSLGKNDIKSISDLKPRNILDTDDQATQAEKLLKIQKIDYTLRTLKTPGVGSHNDGWPAVKLLQTKAGMGGNPDGKFGKDTLGAVKKWINGQE